MKSSDQLDPCEWMFRYLDRDVRRYLYDDRIRQQWGRVPNNSRYLTLDQMDTASLNDPEAMFIVMNNQIFLVYTTEFDLVSCLFKKSSSSVYYDENKRFDLLYIEPNYEAIAHFERWGRTNPYDLTIGRYELFQWEEKMIKLHGKERREWIKNHPRTKRFEQAFQRWGCEQIPAPKEV